MKINGALNALTFDVEDWFQVANLRQAIKYEDWEKCESRVILNVTRIVKLLSTNNTKATFFILGWIAEKRPKVVEIIRNAGHEIATHGYSHKCVYELSKEEFEDDIASSIYHLEKICGEKINGYRAPNYSIRPENSWAWSVLIKNGIKYDSSIFPVKHNRYGYAEAPRFPFVIDLKNNGKLIEFPLSTIRMWGNNIPVAGGAYLRLYPFWFISSAIKKLNEQKRPAIIYLHPWEIDAFQPRVKINFMSKFKHYGNLLTTEQKLKKLITDYQFAPVRDVINLEENMPMNPVSSNEMM